MNPPPSKTSAVPKRRFQWHLSTAVLLVLCAGALLGANLRPPRLYLDRVRDADVICYRGYGWPVSRSGPTPYAMTGRSEEDVNRTIQLLYREDEFMQTLEHSGRQLRHIKAWNFEDVLNYLRWPINILTAAGLLCGVAWFWERRMRRTTSGKADAAATSGEALSAGQGRPT